MLAQGRNSLFGRVGIKGLLVGCLLGAAVLPLAGCQKPNRFLRQEGMNAYADKQYEVSHQKFSQAVTQRPEDWKSQYYLGLIALKQDRPLDAQLALEKSLSLRADHPETIAILDALAESLLMQSKYANLTAMLQEACDHYGRPEDYVRQGIYLGKSGDVDGAKLAFKKAIRFARKDDPTPFIALADFYDSLGSGADALMALRQAYYVDPHNVRVQERIRRHGMIPGPTVAVEPQR